jgi:pectin methylesterase-like acyl-CoA thioesterase
MRHLAYHRLCPSRAFHAILAIAAFTLGPILHSATIYAVNSGGSAVSPFVADAYFSGGSTYGTGSSITTTGVTNAAPATVYQTERYGASTYTFPSLNVGENYTVRLHFAETYHSSSGKRQFNVLINGTQVLTNFDIYAAANGQNVAVVKDFAAVANSSGQIIVALQNGAFDNAKISGIEIIRFVPETPPTANLNFDIDQGSNYSGTAAAPGSGTVWNKITSQSTPSVTLSNVLDSTGKTTTYSVTLASDGGDIRTYSNSSLGNPTPVDLMSDYLWGHTYTATLSGLPSGNYFLYVYAHGDQASQSSTVTLNAANGGGSGTTGSSGSDYLNLTVSGAEGYSYLRFPASVGAAGTLSFTTTYLNGFQLIEYPKPVITLQPAATPLAAVGGNISLIVNATGEGTLTYQWRKAGVPVANGSTGNGSTYSGATTSSLTISNAAANDTGTYDVVITNPGGSTTSSTATLSVTTGVVAPNIAANPASLKALTGDTASFTVLANGTAPLNYQWQKSLNNTDYTDIPGATGPQLDIASLTTANAGYYRAVIANSAGTATSASASLTIAPVISTAVTAATPTAGTAFTLSVAVSVGAGAPEATTYTWKRNGTTVTDGSGITGATTASLQISSFGITQSGYYTVTASNSAGSVTTSPVYVGINSTQVLGVFPANGATNVNPDAPLVVRFSNPPQAGLSGKIVVRKASDDSVVETIDTGAFTVLTSGATTYRYQLKNVGGSGGETNLKYFPIVVVGNEARITLKTGTTLGYGQTYYVTIEPGAILDATGATLQALTTTTQWRFTTKAAAPATVPAKTTYTVAIDGTGDFSTLQGALDHIPTGNTTPVRINVRNGTYQELINYGGRNNITVVGQSRDQTIVSYLDNAPLNGGIATRVNYYSKGNDLVVANLTIANSTPKGGGQAEALRSDGSRNSFLNCTITSFQDTLLLGPGNYFQDCLIQGDADFIWGGGTAMFKNCELRAMNGGDLCQARTPINKFGFVFVDCKLTKAAGGTFNYTFGRNSVGATDAGNAAFINCKIDTHIVAAGWSSGFTNASYPNNIRNWEYQSTNLAGTAPLDVSQRVISRQLTAQEATILRNPANVFGTTTDGTPAGAVGDGWVPSISVIITRQPTAQSVAPGASVTFTAEAVGVPAPTYQWYKNNTAISSATADTFVINSAVIADWATYYVAVANGSSYLPSDSAALRVTAPIALWAESAGLDPAGDGAASADPDHDGIPNSLEFAFGLPPTNSSSATYQHAGATLTASGLPMIESTGGSTLAARYVRRATFATDGLTYTPQFSADLVTWENGAAAPQIIASNTDCQLVEIDWPASLTSAPRKFFRVQVSGL